jgi:hypothetical protein
VPHSALNHGLLEVNIGIINSLLTFICKSSQAFWIAVRFSRWPQLVAQVIAGSCNVRRRFFSPSI